MAGVVLSHPMSPRLPVLVLLCCSSLFPTDATSRMHARGLIQSPANKQQPFASILYTAVIRGKVALPCDVTPPSADDAVSLVLWYKDESPAPIYTLDARRGQLDKARHSAVSELGSRAYFNMMNRPAFLQLDPVDEDDAGEYRCRVDFRKARSVNTVINLKVIGKPRPSVTWWKDYTLVDESYFFSPDGSLVKNKLEIDPITRNDLLAVLSCQAANNNITVPASTSITLNLNLKPLDVAIQHPERPLSANKEVELVCTSSGSRPQATLTWWKNGQQIMSAREKHSNGGVTRSTSILLFTPNVDDNNRILSCRAENKDIPGSALEEGWKLEVYFAPIVTLLLGSSLKDTEIQEGRDVYLDCKIVANPYTVDVEWLFNGQELASNATLGVIVSTQSLVLQRVQRAQHGRYACSATNKEGRGVSKDLYLRVKYAPVCQPGQRLVYGASKDQSVLVKCDLDADPEDVSFHWSFSSSSSGKRIDVTKGIASNSVHSVVNYVPHADDDYGTLFCWGTNSVGIQREACAMSVVPAGPPDSVINCSQINATEDGIFIECTPGEWDGGMSPLVFIGEIYNLETRTLRAKITSTPGSPAFAVRGLPGGTTFRVLVYASNSKGRSAPHIIMAHTLKPAEKLTAGVQAMTILRPVLGAFIGVVVALVIAAVATALLFRCRKGERSKGSEKEQLDNKSLTSLKEDHDETLDIEEKGRDIIPAATVFSGYDVSTEKVMPLTTQADSYSAAVPLYGNTRSLGSHWTASPEKDSGEITYAELFFPKIATTLPNSGSGTLTRSAPSQTAQKPDTPTEYAHIDFHRTLRPVPEDHALVLTGEELEEEGGTTCETPLMSNRRESTV